MELLLKIIYQQPAASKQSFVSNVRNPFNEIIVVCHFTSLVDHFRGIEWKFRSICDGITKCYLL